MIPEIVIENLAKARNYYSNLNAEVIANLKKGCMDCEVKSYTCLKRIITALEDKIELDVYDDVAEKLYTQMMIIIGDYVTQTPPTVNAGSDQSAEIGGTVVFTATGTAGSSPIVSYQWVQISGTPATLTNANTTVLSVSNYPEGAIILKVTVTDENGLKGSDTATLTGTSPTILIKFGYSDSPIDTSTFNYQFSKNIVSGASEYELDFGTGVLLPQYISIIQPSTEPDKVNWFNTVLNQGFMGDGIMKPQQIVGGNDAYGSYSLFVFDGTNTKLKLST